MTDDAIVVHALQSFDAFYRSNYRQVLSCMFGLTEAALAEDLTQEAFLAASRNWDEVQALDNPGAWVRRVAMNRAASAYHRRRTEARALLRLSGRGPAIDLPMSEP